MIKLPSRQVHLDFHTSDLIPDVGAGFDKAQWQEALRAGRLNSITVFAKCHHSWSYYPTTIGKPHPALRRDLLKEQIEASHEIGVRVPIYYTVGWSATDSETHPEWLAINKDGSIQTTNYDVNAKPEDPKPTVSWKNLCPSGSYREHIVAQTKEICDAYSVDGFFYDICFRDPCYCPNCVDAMRAAGIDPADDAAASRYNDLKWQQFMAECNAVIHARWPEATIFYNGGASQYHPQWHVGDTHFELEDLPTSWGGYDKFPIRARYFANTGKDYLAMSGKFHTNWGEFGGFKHPDAIKFEAACMIAYGARCSFGDQLHPNGAMDLSTYKNIGEAYAYIEQIEQYGLDGKPASNLGLWLSGNMPDDQGVANMLMESQLDFEVVSPQRDLSHFATVILPGGCHMTEGDKLVEGDHMTEGDRKGSPLQRSDVALLTEFVKNGGSLVVLGAGVLNQSRAAFMLDTGADYVGPANYKIDYTVVDSTTARTQGAIGIAHDLPASPFLNYSGAIRVAVTDPDAQVLAHIREPYFDRTYGHYCSHQNTPYRKDNSAQPAVWRKGNCVSLAHALGEMYYLHGARVHRQLFINALKLVYTQPVVTTHLPSAGRVSVVHQPQHARYVVHLMYAPPLQRGRCSVIEDIPVLHQVPVKLRVAETVTRVYLAPSGEELPVMAGEVTVPSVTGHQAIVFSYA